MDLRLLVSLCAAGLALVACGDNLRPATEDAAGDGPIAICGDGVIGRGEDCDDGDTLADAVCTATCTFTCGNGVLDDAFGERCDPGITSGAGACPATCDDGMACTADVRAGEGCQVTCEHAAITTPIAGDGCCPTGATSLTDPDCGVVCGNGVLEPGELCDPGIASGAGACPLTCSDGLNCTQDALVGAGTCAAMCTATPITTPVDGDGCCPPGGTPATDDDCRPTCGNGTLDPGETCDLAITGGPGACPTVCTDGMVCTADVLANPGTCTAACAFTPITTPRSGDGCCPPGATPATDNDCPPGCGNGVVDPGETCDTAVLAGPGRCPTTCSDGVACTRDVLTGGGTCTAACSFPPIVTPAPGDGCCPVGANATTDNDCPAVCGNGVVEPGETCDRTIAAGLPGACPTACSDGLACTRDSLTGPGTCTAACAFTPITAPANGDGCCPAGATPATDSDCVVTPTAFRLRDLDLRDPHVFINFIGCRDVTETPLAGFSVNGELQTNVQTDGDLDGDLDLSIATVFRPLDQTAGATPAFELHFPTCRPPLDSTTCTRTPAASPAILTTATNGVGATACLAALTGTIGAPAYSPAITAASAPCYVSARTTLTIDLGGIPITLRDAQIAATYVGAPASNTTNGLLRGFISETEANATILPASLPLVGGQRLSSLLPGGMGNCSTRDDRDTNAGVRGWWFYLNFTAPVVPWLD